MTYLVTEMELQPHLFFVLPTSNEFLNPVDYVLILFGPFPSLLLQ